MKRNMKTLLMAGILAILSISCKKSITLEEENALTNSNKTSDSKVLAVITAKAAMDTMGTGFNLGNTFDRQDKSTDPETIKPIIDQYYIAGMRHIRIPVTWMDGFGGNTIANSDGNIVDINGAPHPRLVQLKAVVNYALGKGMYVIINAHHEYWLKNYYDGSSSYNTKFRNLWRSIGFQFQSYSPRLIFEVLNEPDGVFGDFDSRDGLNILPNTTNCGTTRQINLVGYDAIRSTGGNNSTRIIMVAPNGKGNVSQFDDVYSNSSQLPGGGTDPYVAVTVHHYNRWEFCGENGDNSEYGGRAGLVTGVTNTYNHANSINVAVNYGEFGVGRVDSKESQRNSWQVREYYRTLRREIVSKNMSATAWDDRGWFKLISGNSTSGYTFTYNLVSNMMAESIVGKTVKLKGNNGLYVSGQNGTTMRCNKNTAGDWEKFYVVDIGPGSGKVALRSMGKYVSSENGLQSMRCDRDTVGSYEEFWIEYTADGKVALIGNNLKYVSSENGTINMNCNRTTIGTYEKFDIEY